MFMSHNVRTHIHIYTSINIYIIIYMRIHITMYPQYINTLFYVQIHVRHSEYRVFASKSRHTEEFDSSALHCTQCCQLFLLCAFYAGVLYCA